MKKKLFKTIAKVIKGTAVLSSESTSWTGLYQPRTPQALIKPDKKEK